MADLKRGGTHILSFIGGKSVFTVGLSYDNERLFRSKGCFGFALIYSSDGLFY